MSASKKRRLNTTYRTRRGGAKRTRRVYRNVHYPRCQCNDLCPNPSIKGSAFCKQHQNCTNTSSLSGYEPPYQPDFFNKNRDLHDSHNCAAYAFGHVRPNPKAEDPFVQPGTFSGHPRFGKTRRKTCPDMLARIFGDMPSVKPATFEARCPANTSKIAMAVDARSDYHFWRQDNNGYWSHKPGSTDVTNIDAFGRPIWNPQLASRNYNDKTSKLNYNRFCGYMCVQRKKQPRLKSP
jgi:hypothetical protein